MQALKQFLHSLSVQNRSAHTVSNYRRDVEMFLAFYLTGETEVKRNGEQAERLSQFDGWSTIPPDAIRSFLGDRVQQGISARTLARQLSAIRSFYDFLLLENKVTKNPAKGIRAPKQPQPLPKSLDVDWTRKLLEQPLNSWQDVRDQAVFELLYSAGLRVSECTELDLTPGLDQLKAGWVLVMGKGQKARLAPVGSKAQEAIHHWLDIRNDYAQADERAVFVNRQGGRLSVRSVQKRLDQRTLQAGLPTKMSPHRLRHACATHVLESSGDLRAVQEMLGHANLSTTQIYTKLDLQHLAQVYDQAHPRAKKSK
ncbi:MAG: tyrosine recombinase XerC [Thiomicrorhabdus chilensis]|uniref:tyrosine recombinase XerC n=1 Tax=Thiomicrorhabdus chilensis TaxID=63656 RepID=UPI00299EB070|nr:tyrosine recombinase XerC [Thiomicrorhabdus chilensis]MDX1347635.1 tyrosine recombinase XerC [Thiomicrorhabdus chilensis]